MKTPRGPEGVFDDLVQVINMAIYSNKHIKHFLYRLNERGRLEVVKNAEVYIALWAVMEHIINYADGIDWLTRDEKNEPEINGLINIIFKTIVDSAEVQMFVRAPENQSALSEVLKEDKQTVIPIKINDLIDSTIVQTRPKPLRVTRSRLLKSAEPTEPPQQIDGIPLSKNEEAFEEYCVERFDETDWLKKLRLFFKPTIKNKNDKNGKT